MLLTVWVTKAAAICLPQPHFNAFGTYKAVDVRQGCLARESRMQRFDAAWLLPGMCRAQDIEKGQESPFSMSFQKKSFHFGDLPLKCRALF